MAMAAEAQAAGKRMMLDHLDEFSSRNPEGSFISWIAELHPENLKLDSRVDRPDSEWRKMWEEHARSGRGMCGGGSSSNAADQNGTERPLHGGLLDIVFGVTFAISAIFLTAGLEFSQSIFLSLARAFFAASKLGNGFPRCSLLGTPVLFLRFLAAVFCAALRAAAFAFGVAEMIAITSFAACAFVTTAVLALSVRVGVANYRRVRDSCQTTVRYLRWRPGVGERSDEERGEFLVQPLVV
jgi:hypothetical protein